MDGGDVDPMLGKEILGTYRIEAILGRGGMAVVYRGTHILTEQEVAIKVLPPELAGHSEVKARLCSQLALQSRSHNLFCHLAGGSR